jgi:pSer/pThr/pTyr-binding forkhead associated (FHA) protein
MAIIRYHQDDIPVEVTLDSDDVTVGRGDECVLQIRGDGEISRLHCSFQRRDENKYVVMDSASRNGTFVNGVRLLSEARELMHGDRVRVGRTHLVYYESKPGGVIGQEEIFSEMAQTMEENDKGFGTLMNEIVEPAKPGASSDGA